MTADQFIDMCILCGCDYCDSIRGIGPGKAYTFIKQHGTIEKLLQHLDTSKCALRPAAPPQPLAQTQ
jgi:flap endonuclease-1